MKNSVYAFAIICAFEISPSVLLNAQVSSMVDNNMASSFNHLFLNDKQSCEICHIAQKAQKSTAPLLWNQQLKDTSYALYSSSNSIQGINGVVAPMGISKICLSCHDGLISSPIINKQLEEKTLMTYKRGLADLGTGLDKHHPISIDYEAARDEGRVELRDTTDVYATSYDFASGIYVPGTTKTIGSLLVNGKVECTSCHGMHKYASSSNLRMSNRGSLLCLACHVR